MDLDPVVFKDTVERSRKSFRRPERKTHIADHVWCCFVDDILDGKLSLADAQALLDDVTKIDARLDAAETSFWQVAAPLYASTLYEIRHDTALVLKLSKEQRRNLVAVHGDTQELKAVSSEVVDRVGHVERSTSVPTAVVIAITTGIASSLLTTWAYPHLFGQVTPAAETSPPGRNRGTDRGEPAGSDPPATSVFRINPGLRLHIPSPQEPIWPPVPRIVIMLPDPARGATRGRSPKVPVTLP